MSFDRKTASEISQNLHHQIVLRFVQQHLTLIPLPSMLIPISKHSSPQVRFPSPVLPHLFLVHVHSPRCHPTVPSLNLTGWTEGIYNAAQGPSRYHFPFISLLLLPEAAAKRCPYTTSSLSPHRCIRHNRPSPPNHKLSFSLPPTPADCPPPSPWLWCLIACRVHRSSPDNHLLRSSL